MNRASLVTGVSTLCLLSIVACDPDEGGKKDDDIDMSPDAGELVDGSIPDQPDGSVPDQPDGSVPDDPDRDADGIEDSEDNCPDTKNADQLDADSDGVGDACDNCAAQPNPDQTDGDADEIGDLCDGEPIDNAALLYVPAGTTVTLSGARCYTEQVIVAGKLQADGSGTGTLIVKAPKVLVAQDGVISADAAGALGGMPSAQLNRGGLAGEGEGAGCAGGPGEEVGQGGSGAGYGGAGGAPNNEYGSSTENVCGMCSEPTEGHCAGVPGAPYGTVDGSDVTVGSGGGAGGNSDDCSDSGGRGGRGGGAIVLVAESVQLDGTLSADGEAPPAPMESCGYRPGGGGGSGGTVLVSAQGLRGAGVMRALGGAGGEALGYYDLEADYYATWGWAGGGGGGGRIKIFAATNEFTGSTLVSGGAGGAAPPDEDSAAGAPGADGTVHTGTTQPDDLSALTCDAV